MSRLLRPDCEPVCAAALYPIGQIRYTRAICGVAVGCRGGTTGSRRSDLASMFKPYTVFIGARYTAAKRQNHFISFTPLSSMIGLMLGVAVLITVLSVMNGFDRELRQRILGMVSHASIHGYQPIDDWELIRDRAMARPEIAGAAPFIHEQGMVTARGNVQGVMLSGILPDAEAQVSIIDENMVMGKLQDLQSGEFGIVIGELLAHHLGVGPGDKLTI